MNPYKFFDQFGILIFSFLIIDSLFYLKAKKDDWRAWLRFTIGIGGLVVDSYLVFFF